MPVNIDDEREYCRAAVAQWIDRAEPQAMVHWLMAERAGARSEGYAMGQRNAERYELGTDDRGHAFITCKMCMRRSFHPKDIENRYCGACHRFHHDP